MFSLMDGGCSSKTKILVYNNDRHTWNKLLPTSVPWLFKVLCEKTYFKIKEDNELLEVAYELEMILPNDSKKEQ